VEQLLLDSSRVAGKSKALATSVSTELGCVTLQSEQAEDSKSGQVDILNGGA